MRAVPSLSRKLSSKLDTKEQLITRREICNTLPRRTNCRT
jgi:hypothetical protein